MPWQPPDTNTASPETIRQIVADLADSDPDIRLRAIDLVSQWYYEDRTVVETTLPHIVALLSDEDRAVRISAAYTVGEVGGPEVAPILLGALDSATGDRGLQLVIIKVMGRVNQPDVAQRLAYVFHLTDSRCLRVAARKAIERIGTPEALAMLVC
jgi:HEAT repeat protein